MLVRGLIFRTQRARSRWDARPQCRDVSGCGRSRGAIRAVRARAGGWPCPLKAHSTTHERASRLLFFCPYIASCFVVVSHMKPHHKNMWPTKTMLVRGQLKHGIGARVGLKRAISPPSLLHWFQRPSCFLPAEAEKLKLEKSIHLNPKAENPTL